MFNAELAVEEALERISQKPLKKLQEEERAKLKDIGSEGAKVELGHRYVRQATEGLRSIQMGKGRESDTAFRLEQLAHGYFLTGEIDLAVEFTEKHKRHYKAYIKAVNEEKRCGHRGEKVKTKLGTVIANGIYLKERFLFKGTWYNLMACNKCGHQYAE